MEVNKRDYISEAKRFLKLFRGILPASPVGCSLIMRSEVPDVGEAFVTKAKPCVGGGRLGFSSGVSFCSAPEINQSY